MVRTLRAIFSTSSQENSSIYGLNAAESDWYVKLSEQLLSCLSIVIAIVVCNYFLVEFEEVNPV
jgi:hypothetical protein